MLWLFFKSSLDILDIQFYVSKLYALLMGSNILIFLKRFTSENKYTKMYLKYIYLMLSILQIHLHISILNKNTLQLYF